MYTDYEFYKETYGGNKVSSTEFTNLAVQASILVDYYTFNRIKEPDNKVKFAVCELVDYFKKLEDTGGKEVVSEKVSTHSITYVDTAKEGQDPVEKKKRDIIIKYLGHSGLMYRGG